MGSDGDDTGLARGQAFAYEEGVGARREREPTGML